MRLFKTSAVIQTGRVENTPQAILVEFVFFLSCPPNFDDFGPQEKAAPNKWWNIRGVPLRKIKISFRRNTCVGYLPWKSPKCIGHQNKPVQLLHTLYHWHVESHWNRYKLHACKRVGDLKPREYLLSDSKGYVDPFFWNTPLDMMLYVGDPQRLPKYATGSKIQVCIQISLALVVKVLGHTVMTNATKMVTWTLYG